MFLLLKITVLLGLCWSAEPSAAAMSGEINPRLHVLGTADGKTFFVEEGIMTWFEARKYCEDMGMKLGSTSRGSHIRLWEAAYNPSYFANNYWTAARDRLESSQFVWDTTATELVHMDSFSHMGTPKSCLYYMPGDEHHGFRLASCNDRVGVICELET